MIDLALITFTTLFATVSPIDTAAVFAALTANLPGRQRAVMAIRGTAIATLILLAFAFFGDFILGRLGVTLDALRIAGGILLLLIAIDMVFGRHSTASGTTAEEAAEAATRTDISVFPLATPFIAGPGAMGAMILLVGNVEGDIAKQSVVIGVMLGVMVVTLCALLLAAQVQRLLGVTAINVIARVFGVLLAALAVQFMINGIRGIGALG